jgi:NADH-quinone oxidoreductase subunit C
MQNANPLDIIKAKFPEAVLEENTNAVIIPKERFLEAARYLKTHESAFDSLHCLTAIDRKDRIEVVYVFYSLKNKLKVTLKVNLQNDDLKVESISSLWKSADWFEREVYDLFGVKFMHHPNLKRIMSPDNWQGHPLRKDFSHPNIIKKPQ